MRNVLIIPTTIDGGRGTVENTASARIRALWASKYWEECHLYTGVERVYNADVVVFQKAYYSEAIRAQARDLHDRGIGVVLDLCDPVWRQGGRAQLTEMLGYCDFAVASTEPIREYLGRFVPTHTIPDRLDLSTFPQRWSPLSHGVTQAAWYGYSANYDAVSEFLPHLQRLEMSLTTISDRPFPDGHVGFIPWSLDTVNDAVSRFDLVVNPKGSESRFKYKSDNKTVMARAMGIPVAVSVADLERLAVSSARLAESAHWLARRGEFDVRLSVDQWRALLDTYYQ